MAYPPSAFADASITITKGASAGQACVTLNNCFSPNNVQVAPGDTVTWTNGDSASHTVTSITSDNQTGTVFDSGLIKAGTTFQNDFNASGTFNYFCTVHPWMTGVVTVSTGAAQQLGIPYGAPDTAPNGTTTNNTAVPEFGPVASLVMVIAVVSVVAVTAKTGRFLNH
jgi:plastocyanin